MFGREHLYLTDGNQTDSILKARDKCVDTLPPLGSGDSSVDRAPDSLSKGFGFESRQVRRENRFLWGSLSCADSYPVFVPAPCYGSST